MLAASPGVWLVAIGGLGVLLLWLGRRKTGAWLASASTLGFVLVLLLPIDQWALLPLENRFPAPPTGQHYDGILVLGGTIDSALTEDRGIPALNASAERLTTFAAQAALHPEARLVFTGGPLPSRPHGPREATGARLLLTQLGIPPGRVIYEENSTTTWENAVFTRELVHPQPGERWLMITSASHMPRAIGAFRRVDWTLEALPVGYKSFAQPEHRTSRGLAERLSLIDLAAHEWIGLAYYFLRDRSTSLFPQP